MNLVFLLGLQAAATPAPPAAAPRVDAIRFDLATAGRPRDRGVRGLFTCDRSGGDVVVCGHRPGWAYPLDEMARIFEAKHLVAETGLGGGAKGGVYVQRVDLGSTSPSAHSGLTSNRIMVGIKMPF